MFFNHDLSTSCITICALFPGTSLTNIAETVLAAEVVSQISEADIAGIDPSRKTVLFDHFDRLTFGSDQKYYSSCSSFDIKQLKQMSRRPLGERQADLKPYPSDLFFW